MDDDHHIAEAAAALGVTPGYLRLLEKQERIPSARRDAFGARTYSRMDVAILKGLGVGSRRRLRSPEELLESSQ